MINVFKPRLTDVVIRKEIDVQDEPIFSFIDRLKEVYNELVREGCYTDSIIIFSDYDGDDITDILSMRGYRPENEKEKKKRLIKREKEKIRKIKEKENRKQRLLKDYADIGKELQIINTCKDIKGGRNGTFQYDIQSNESQRN